MAKRIAEFVAEVVTGEGGTGSVYLDAFSDGRAWYVGVARDSLAPDYKLTVEPTDDTLTDIEHGLVDGGLAVYRSQKEWEGKLNDWHAMGGGDGKAW